MSLRYLTRRTALNAATKIPVITNLNHTRSIPRAWLIRNSKHDPKLKSVRPADRIKWWNIVPGDTICLRGDPERKLHEVLSVNRLSNRVFLKNSSHVAKPGHPPPPAKNYHYSKCQLYIGEIGEFPNMRWDRPETDKLFAVRVSMNRPKWDYVRHCFTWRRYATALYPRVHLPGKLRIPWPARVARTFPKASLYDTEAEVVQKITYEMPYFNPAGEALVNYAPERAYLDYVYAGAKYHASQPFERYLQLDLANPHSRAKKLERFRAFQQKQLARKKAILAREMENRDGRTSQQVHEDAAFLFKQESERAAKRRKRARWMNTERRELRERKIHKKQLKANRQQRQLTMLALEEEANQVVPKALKDQEAARRFKENMKGYNLNPLAHLGPQYRRR